MVSETSAAAPKMKSGGFFSRFGKGFRRPPLGKVLVSEGVISEEQLRRALEVQKGQAKQLGRIVVDEGFASEYAVLQAITKHYRVSAGALSDDLEELIRHRPLSFLEKFSSARIPIRIKLSIAITFIIWLTILILSFVILARQRGYLYSQAVTTGTVSLNYFANDAPIPLIEDDLVRLNTLIKEAASVKEISYAAIVGKDGTIKAHTEAARIGGTLAEAAGGTVTKTGEGVTYVIYKSEKGENILNLFKPVAFSGKDLGVAHVGVSLDFIDRQIRRESITIILLSLFIIVLGIAISILIGVGFARPINQLVLATQEIGKGNFQFRLGMIRRDELGDLAVAFNYMSHELYRKLILQKSFGQYVSPEVLEMVMSSTGDRWLKGTRSEATMLFADIRGFTAFSEHREPEEVVEDLNQYFQIATACILAEGGYIDKFIGDAVLGVFGVPVARADHAQRALRAAVAMQKSLATAAAEGKNPLLSKVGISINSGVVVAGNLGSEVKLEYTVIGDAVNLASRLNGFAEGGRVVMSASTKLAAGEIVAARPLPPQQVKGKAEPVEIWLLEELREKGGETKA
jgi:adenylate cyclase